MVLEISKLQTLGRSLKMRWLWLKEIDSSQSWSMFPIQVHKSVHTSFSMASGQWCWNLILAWQVDSWPTDSWSCTSFLFVTREEQTRELFLIPHWSCLGHRHPRCFDSRWYHWIPCPPDIISELILQPVYQTPVFGSFLGMGHTWQHLHMLVISRVLFVSDHGRGYRRFGHQASVVPSCG